MELNPELIQIIAPQLVAIGAMWLRIESRLTRLETNYSWLVAGRRQRPIVQPPADSGDVAGRDGAP